MNVYTVQVHYSNSLYTTSIYFGIIATLQWFAEITTIIVIIIVGYY